MASCIQPVNTFKFSVIVNYLCTFFLCITLAINSICNAHNVTFSFGAGNERIAYLIKSQNENLFTRFSMSKEFLNLERSKLNLGFEVAALSGFSGSLEISDALQDVIGGPTPIISSGPRIEILATAKKYLKESNAFFVITKLGIQFNNIAFDRYDFDKFTTINFIGYLGFGLELTQKSEINIILGRAKSGFALSSLHLNSNLTYNPYSQIKILISYGYLF